MGEVQQASDRQMVEVLRECSSRVEQFEIPLKASELEMI